MEYRKLTDENIAAVCGQLYDDLAALGFKQKTAADWQNTAESIMRAYLERFGGEIDFAYSTARHFGRVKASLYFRCASFNPLQETDNALSGLSRLLTAQDAVPVWKWSGGENCITVTAKKKHKVSGVAKMFLSAAAAICCAFLSKLLPVPVRSFIDNSVVVPLFQTFMRAINCIASPLIFLMVACSIYNVGDVAALEKVGKKLLSRLLCHSYLFLLLFVLAMCLMYNVSFDGYGSLDFNYIANLFLGIVPNNVITPFLEGNTLQVLFLGVVTGLCMLILDKKISAVTELFLQLSDMAQFIMDYLGKSLINLFIFLSVYKMTLTKGMEQTGSFCLVLPLVFLPCLLAMLICLLATSCRFKISPMLIAKKQAEPTLIAFTTDSSFIATIPSIDVCCNKLGIDKNLSNFGVALGNVIFRFAPACQYAALAFILAKNFGIPVTLQWVMTMQIIAYAIALASPPVVGGRLATCAIFSAQIGLPDSATSFFVMFMILGGFISTASKIFCTQHELIWLAADMGKLDREILKSSC